MEGRWNSTPAERTAGIERVTMDAKEAAAYLNISYWLVLESAKKKILPSIRIGGRVLFRKSSLDRFMDEQEAGNVRQEPERGKLRVIGL